MKKTVIILRGVSGSGKSTVANALAGVSDKAVVCTADDFFSRNGDYTFNPLQLGEAHNWCFEQFCQALNSEDCEMVIQANTNTSEREFKRYKEYAEERGHKVFVLTVENWHGGKNQHSVPQSTLEKQEKRLRGSIQL